MSSLSRALLPLVVLVPLACSDAASAPDAPRVRLPADDAVHNSPVEWWHWTGHVQDEAQRWYGFQFTIFLLNDGKTRTTLANVAWTDVAGQSYQSAVELGMAEPEIRDGAFAFALGPHSAQGGDGVDRLIAELEGTRFDLSLESLKPPVMHHGDGYQDYAFGGHTYYYSRTRLQVLGTVVVGEETRALRGQAWLDRQWGDLQSAADRGWDWMAIQLDDGRDLMLFFIHPENEGARKELLVGTIIDAQGTGEAVDPQDVEVEVLGHWTSPLTGFIYPSGWKLRWRDLELVVTPVVPHQEVDTRGTPGRSYWEGAATVMGGATGRAYVELTECEPED